MPSDLTTKILTTRTNMASDFDYALHQLLAELSQSHDALADRVAALEQSVAKWLKADAEMKVIAKKWSEPAADAGLMARMGRAISALLLYRAALKAGRDGDEGGFELIGKAREACGGNADHAWKFAEAVLAEYDAAVDERKANV